MGELEVNLLAPLRLSADAAPTNICSLHRHKPEATSCATSEFPTHRIFEMLVLVVLSSYVGVLCNADMGNEHTNRIFCGWGSQVCFWKYWPLNMLWMGLSSMGRL